MSTRNLNACWESESIKSATSDGYAEKPHSHDHAAMYGIQCSAKPWISGSPYDRGANHNETSWGRGFLGTVPQAYPVRQERSWGSPLKHAGPLEALPSRMSTNAMQDSSTLRRMLIQKQTRVMYACKAVKGFNKVVASPRIRRL